MIEEPGADASRSARSTVESTPPEPQDHQGSGSPGVPVGSDPPVADPGVLAGLNRNGFVNLVARVGGQILAYVSIILVSRATSDQAFGWLAILLAWFGLAAVLATAGLEFVSLRFLKLYLDDGRLGKARSLSLIAARTAILGGLGLAVLIEVALVLSGSIEARYLALLALVPIVPTTAYLAIRRNEMFALERPLLAQLPGAITRPLVTILIIGILLGLGSISDPFILGAIALGGGYSLAAVVALLIGRAVMRPIMQASHDGGETGEWLSIGFFMIMATFGFLAMNQVDTIMLGFLRPEEQAGYYNAAYRIVAGLGLPMIALQNIIASRMSRAHVRGDVEGLRKISGWVANRVSLLTTCMVIGILVFGDFLLGLFGPNFREAGTALQILSLGYLVVAFLGPTGYLLHLTGSQRALASIVMGGFILNLLGNSFLIRSMGITGAALSTSMAMVLVKLVMVFVIRKRLGVWSFVSFGPSRGDS